MLKSDKEQHLLGDVTLDLLKPQPNNLAFTPRCILIFKQTLMIHGYILRVLIM